MKTVFKVTDDGMYMIGPVRLGFVALARPRLNKLKDGGKLEFSVVGMLPMREDVITDTAAGTLLGSDFALIAAEFEVAIENLGIERLGENGKLPKKFVSPLRLPDDAMRDDSVLRGHKFFNASADVDHPPILINANGSVVQDRETIRTAWVSGDWGYLKLKPYAYDKAGNKGVGLGLIAVKFAFSDDPFFEIMSPEETASQFDALI